MAEPSLLVDRRAGYRMITLNRPARLNAFDEAMHRALAAAVAECEADPSCRTLLLTGAGRGFCAGQDLTERVAQPDTQQDVGGAHLELPLGHASAFHQDLRDLPVVRRAVDRPAAG